MALRSRRNRAKSFVRFINNTNRDVDIIWIDFSGAFVTYKLLSSNEFVDINTFKDHPWIAMDHETGDRLHIEKKFVYYPETSLEYFQRRYPDNNFVPFAEHRFRVSITLPVYSLRYRCLLEVRNIIKDADKVNELFLPKNLKEDLKKLINHRRDDANLLMFIDDQHRP